MDCSSTWKRPSAVLKTHKKKKRISLQPTSNPDKNIESLNSHDGVIAKRKNPFSSVSVQNKKVKREEADFELFKTPSPTSSTFFAVLDKAELENGDLPNLRVEKATHDGKITKDSLIDEDEVSQFDFIEKFSRSHFQRESKMQTSAVESKQELSPASQDKRRVDIVPLDWSLKVKMRVVSSCSLAWCSQLKTVDEANGVTDYVTGDNQETRCQGDEKSWLQKCCLYWIYPNIPWLRLFPRIIPDSKLRSVSISLQDASVSAELQNDWTESFSSVFHQLRAKKCPYFYVCTHQFTVLFRAIGMAGQSNVHAYLSPTTRGFREALKKEGIDFEMPVLDKKRTLCKTVDETRREENKSPDASESDKPDEDKDEYDDDFLQTDEGASVWLESIGLDKKQFPSLDPDKVKIQKEGFKVIDNRPESLIYIQGGDVQGLFNYLLNCRSCVSSTGPFAGVPPTILAPSPFKGATLKSHKVKHSIVRQKEIDFKNQPMHILEIAGPILPHHVQSFASLFRHAQKDKFNLTFNTHEPTVPFNFILPKNSEMDINKERSALGMKDKRHDSFFNSVMIADRLSCLKELHCDSNGYSWTT